MSRQQALIGRAGMPMPIAAHAARLLTGAAWSGLLSHHEWFWPFSHAVDRTLLVIGLAVFAAGAALLGSP
jgi:hypothetical protein